MIGSISVSLMLAAFYVVLGQRLRFNPSFIRLLCRMALYALAGMLILSVPMVLTEAMPRAVLDDAMKGQLLIVGLIAVYRTLFTPMFRKSA